MIPVSVVVTVRNEESRIRACLEALRAFGETVVVDSESADATAAIAARCGARVVPFQWNGRYPKKRQWCLDNLTLKHDWVFFVDADEIVTPELETELAALFANGLPPCAGYFVKGRYVLEGKPLRFGLCNNKLALLDRRKTAFPVIDDLDIPGMGEMEGHYQPVLKAGHESDKIGQLRAALLHHAYGGRPEDWVRRHERYAAWERGMNAKNAWPADPVRGRHAVKKLFRATPFRPLIAFAHCYFLKSGWRDGYGGFRLALDRLRYYRMISR